MTGFLLMPLIFSLIDGDDGLDEYMKLSAWERQNNFMYIHIYKQWIS